MTAAGGRSAESMSRYCASPSSARRGEGQIAAFRSELPFADSPIARMPDDDQHPKTDELIGHFARSRGVAVLQAHGKSKCRALSRTAARPRWQPPMASTRRLEIDSPRPVPPNLRVVELSAWMNGANRVVDPVRRDADAGVADGKRQRHLAVRAPGVALKLKVTSPRLGELDRIAEQIQENLPQSQRVAAEKTRRRRVDVHQQLQALLGGAQRHRVDGVLDDALNVEIDRFQCRAGRPRSSRNRGCR